MDFDSDGLASPQGLEWLTQVQKEADRADAANAHNMSIKAITALGKKIAEYCLVTVAKNARCL